MKLIGKSACIAKKYAKAFMRVAGSRFTADDYRVLGDFDQFLAQTPHLMIVFKVPLFSDEKKSKFLTLLLERFHVSECVKGLFHMLLSHGRIALIRHVVYMIRLLYQEEHKIMIFSITGSHALEEKRLEKIQKFLARKTGHTILYTYKIDNTLISGIRAQSDTLLWECSIRQRLRIVRRALVPV